MGRAMIKIRYRDSNELSPGLHAAAERHGRSTTVYLLSGLTAAERRAALRRLRLSARMGYCPRLPAAQLALALLVDRIRTTIGQAGAVFRLHPGGQHRPGHGDLRRGDRVPGPVHRLDPGPAPRSDRHRVVGRGDLAGGLGRRDPHYRDVAGPGRGTGRPGSGNTQPGPGALGGSSLARSPAQAGAGGRGQGNGAAPGGGSAQGQGSGSRVPAAADPVAAGPRAAGPPAAGPPAGRP